MTIRLNARNIAVLIVLAIACALLWSLAGAMDRVLP